MLFTGYHLVENMQNLSKIFIATFWLLRKGGKNHKRTVQKGLTDPFSHSGVVTHLETDILKCEVKWTLGSITMNKARWWNSSWAISNSKRWCCESAALNMPANVEKSAVATGLEKISFHSNPKEVKAKECSNYCTTAVVSHANKIMPQILEASLQQYQNF